MITDNQIDYYFIVHQYTGQTIKLGENLEHAKVIQDNRNNDGDHTDDQPWELFAKLK